jgi:predicted AAA+ superfamily ATPase
MGKTDKEPHYERKLVGTIATRLQEPRRFIQIIAGPRQTGKTTAIRQALTKLTIPCHIASADQIATQSAAWLENEWRQARALIDTQRTTAVLVVDEIQNIPQWSSTVKSLWDEDTWNGTGLLVVLSGSSSLLIQKGLSESLMGRFEVVWSTHWIYHEMRDAFGYSLDDFLFFGGYPGAACLKHDETRWREYMGDSVIEATLSKDVLQMEDVRKPALLRNLFFLGAQYSGQELSYRKILGQLDDRGNAATIAHYLHLLSQAGLICGIQKYDGKELSARQSSPRLMVYNTSLMTATNPSKRMMLEEPGRGHLVESAIGAYLLAKAQEQRFDVRWWREGNHEVDFVIRKGDRVSALEVKSGRVKGTRGLTAFTERFPQAQPRIIGDRNTSIEEFLADRIALFP